MDNKSQGNARIYASVPIELKEEMERAATRFNLNLAAYVGMVSKIGHKALTKGERVIYTEAKLSGEGK